MIVLLYLLFLLLVAMAVYILDDHDKDDHHGI